jgi:hypothetical protein
MRNLWGRVFYKHFVPKGRERREKDLLKNKKL